MRVTSLQCLSMLLLGAAICLAVTGVGRAQNGPPSTKGKGQVAKKAPSKDVVPPAPIATWAVKGRGRTIQDAEKNAITNACKEALIKLKDLNPPLDWMPSAEFVRNNMLSKESERVPEDDAKIPGTETTMLCWQWTVTLSPQHIQALRKEHADFQAELASKLRHLQSEERMLLLAKPVAWFVLALVGLCLYLRLDEQTQGMHRAWLRLALCSLLISGGLGWWLLS